MAIAPTLPLVSVDEYLNSSYEYDREYVDGVLVERSLPTPAHSVLAAIVAAYFYSLRRKFKFAVLPECRTQIVKRARYRIPDILLCACPVPKGKVFDSVPLAVIEILSPDDRATQQIQRFREYWTLGIRQIILLDPEECLAFRYEGVSLTEGEIGGLQLPDGSEVPFSSTQIFQELKEELARQS